MKNNMTIIEKLYQGEIIPEKELESLAFGYSFRGCDKLGDNYIFEEEIEGELNRWAQDMRTIFRVDDDYWCVPWQRGLTKYQENEFWDQPYRVIPKTEQIVVTRYERMD